MAYLEIKDLTFTYPDGSRALENVSLSLGEGEILLLLGDSGSGKTTLLKNIKNELAPFGKRQGTVTLGGNDVTEFTRAQSAGTVGYVFQDPSDQIVTDKVWHELAFGLENLDTPQEKMSRTVAETADYFGLSDLMDQDTDSLSGGQKQLLNLASVMAMHPDLLLLDEPTSMLDPISARRFLDMVERLREEFSLTVIITEHRIEEVYPIADAVGVLDQGRLTCLEKKGDMVLSGDLPDSDHLPVAARVFLRYMKSVNHRGNERIPMTVPEGRAFLRQIMAEKNNSEGRPADNESADHVSESSSAAGAKAKPGKDYIISIKDMYFRYRELSDDVLKGMSITVSPGECVGILGGNGSGKSTMLRAVAGIIQPYRGRVRKCDSTGLLPQDPKLLFSEDTVGQEIKGRIEKLQRSDLKKAETAEKISSDILKRMELEKKLSSHPYDLSGGEQQRLGIIITLMYDPKLILLDEPTKGLEKRLKKVLGDIIAREKEQGKGIIIVSHDVEFLAEYADRCGLFFQGSISGAGDTRTFMLENQFYTTAARRMSRGVTEDAIDEDEISAQLLS